MAPLPAITPRPVISCDDQREIPLDSFGVGHPGRRGDRMTTIIVNTSTGRTNVLQGVVHILLFVAYVILLFD